MTISKIVILLFLFLEAMNVLTLYFAPASKYGNGIGIFNAWEKSKENPDVHNLVKYLVNWVAGTKLIFIMLLVVIVLLAGDELLFYTNIAMVLSIASFFWRLFPMIRQMDAANQISPKGYSKTLGWMILAFIGIFLIPIGVAIFGG